MEGGNDRAIACAAVIKIRTEALNMFAESIILSLLAGVYNSQQSNILAAAWANDEVFLEHLKIEEY